MKTKKPTKVRVKAVHIRKGIAGDCYRCAVARALQAATGDSDARVAEVDWELKLIVWSRYIDAPRKVRHFVRVCDHDLDRDEDGRPKLPAKLPEELAPFEFTLPPMDDPDWEESCYRCEELFAPSELDDEGYCEDCRVGD